MAKISRAIGPSIFLGFAVGYRAAYFGLFFFTVKIEF